MTVQELIDRLAALPADVKQMPVQIQWWPTGIDLMDEPIIVEEIDTIIPPQSWGLQKGRVTLTSYN